MLTAIQARALAGDTNGSVRGILDQIATAASDGSGIYLSGDSFGILSMLQKRISKGKSLLSSLPLPLGNLL